MTALLLPHVKNVLNENTVRTEGIQMTTIYNEFYISIALVRQCCFFIKTWFA